MGTRQARLSPIRYMLGFTLLPLIISPLAASAEMQSVSGQSPSVMVSISGRVTYGNGSPAPGAWVGVRSFSAHQGILPRAEQTDKNGSFSFHYPPWGSGYLYASMPERGYPDPTIALYDRRNAKSMKMMELVPGARIGGVVLELDHPLTLVRFQVTDAEDGNSVSNARVAVKWVDDSSISLGSTLPADGLFDLLMPDHDVDVVIDSENFQTWHLRTNAAQYPTTSTVRAPFTIQVKLKRLAPSPPK